MDWTMLGAVGELVGAVAVVASLLYVGRQVQHNTTIARSAVRHELSSEMTAIAMAVASEPTLAAAFAKVQYNGLTREDATEMERIQLGYSFTALLGLLNLAYNEAADGVLSDTELEEMFGPNTHLLQAPYLKTVWPLLRSAYGDSFAKWFEARYGFTAGGELHPG